MKRTPEEQEIITKKRLATMKKNRKGKRRKYVRKEKAFSHAAFLAGKIVRDIEHYAASNEIPVNSLASEVATLLRYQTGG